MSQRLTVGDLINDAQFNEQLGLCPDRSASDRTKFLSWGSEAEERLLAYGRWWGSIVEAQFCVRNGCLVWPREVATIEQVAVCGTPLPIHNEWYQFTAFLARVQNCDGCRPNPCNRFLGSCHCGHIQMRMNGALRCSVDVTRGANKVLRFYPSHSDDVGKKILVQGYDENRIWVRTVIGGVPTDGEQVVLALPFVDTLTTWFPGSPTAIQKERTSYLVRMYEADTVTTEERFLSEYQPTETRPNYRSSLIPGFKNFCCGQRGTCDTEQSSDHRKTVTALVQLNHLPWIVDTDWVLFQNRAAYKEAMMAVKYWQAGDMINGNARFYGMAAPKQARMSNQATLRQGGAIPMLRAELRAMTGDVTEVYIHYEADNRLAYEMAGFR